MSRQNPKSVRLALITACLAALLSACGNDSRGDEPKAVGRTQINLTLPDGSELSSVSWVITGGAYESSPRTGEIDVGDADDTVSAFIGSIPVATGYTIELSGLTSEGLACSADADFDMPSAGTTVSVSITLNCGLGDSRNDGDLVVNGQVNACPTVDIVAAPIDVAVGNTIDLEAEAEDANDDEVTYAWSATAGTFDEADHDHAHYTCTLAGPVTIQLVIDDGFDCDVTREIDVTCSPDASGSDQDGDGIVDASDNCPDDDNPGQEDADADGTGDLCDDDRDGDGVANASDNCPDDANAAQEDQDSDGFGDACDDDTDGDGIDDDLDNCPFTPNADQVDGDVDGVGDACESDADGDGIDDGEDNCPDVPNADQADFDGDGAGDACDPVFYTAGHGDMAFEFEVADGELEVNVHIEGGTVDGVDDVDGEFPTELLHIVTDATFARPDPDSGAYELLCVDPGDSVFWLPQSNADASANDVPFLGLANEAPAGEFVDDTLLLELVDVASPAGTGAYSMWRPDLLGPEFSMSSCDGIDATDAVSLPPGHDHFNMGFGADGVGTWDVTYRISGELTAGGTVSEEFTVHYEIQ